jgi:hypothetical protein
MVSFVKYVRKLKLILKIKNFGRFDSTTIPLADNTIRDTVVTFVEYVQKLKLVIIRAQLLGRIDSTTIPWLIIQPGTQWSVFLNMCKS